eukprot:1064125-Lingulodinium_polyedra.AAC.1
MDADADAGADADWTCVQSTGFHNWPFCARHLSKTRNPCKQGTGKKFHVTKMSSMRSMSSMN